MAKYHRDGGHCESIVLLSVLLLLLAVTGDSGRLRAQRSRVSEGVGSPCNLLSANATKELVNILDVEVPYLDCFRCIRGKGWKSVAEDSITTVAPAAL